MQQVTVHHLGPIIEMQVDINKINVLIGEQAVGKSTLCKAIYFFRSIKNEIKAYLGEISVTQKDFFFPHDLNKPIKDMFIELFGYSWDLDSRLYMKYQFSVDIWIEVKLASSATCDRQYIQLEYSPELRERIQKYGENIVQNRLVQREIELNLQDSLDERLRNRREIEKNINDIFKDYAETYYIPAGRSLLTLMTNQKTKLDYASMDLVNRRFMQLIESVQAMFDNGITEAHGHYPNDREDCDVKKIASSMLNDLKGEYYYKNGKEYLLLNNKRKVNINFASSGQQELLWLYNQLYILLLRRENAFVIIEEPEAHLYPSLQKEVMDFIVQFAYLNNSTVYVTTHSPYLLVEANTLYYAGRVYEKASSQVEEIMGEWHCILPRELSAYKLYRNKKEDKSEIENLLDTEIDELKTELIDDISNKINENYTALYYLEEELNAAR